jgi:hypothetical protein
MAATSTVESSTQSFVALVTVKAGATVEQEVKNGKVIHTNELNKIETPKNLTIFILLNIVSP